MAGTMSRTKNAAPMELANNTVPVVWWAWLGVAALLFFVYVMGRWLTLHAAPVDPGPDPLPDAVRYWGYFSQFMGIVGGLVFGWFTVVRTWRREGRMTTVGMLYLCWLTLFFQDPMMNYTSATLFYNSHLVNLGSWTLGSTPGWTSPNGNQLPEPLLQIIGGYTLIGYFFCFPVIAMLNKIRERRPMISKLRLAFIGILLLIVFDTLSEAALLRTGLYAYPGAIRAISLFPGETYQFPMSEGVFYGGFTIGSTLLLLLYRNDKGQTFVERGLENLRIGTVAKQWVKFLALFGFVHLSMFLVFTVPMQWFCTHSDPFPQGYPSYMKNGLCVYGPNRDQCPGPGVMMPRPLNNPF